MKRKLIIAGCLAPVILPVCVRAAVPLSAEPVWTSSDEDYATGGMFWDLDGDGYLDFVVGNGNDMAQEYNAVYYNHAGAPETMASWRSSGAAFNGQLDLGDVDRDGDLDAVITGFLAPTMLERLYRNDGGRLSHSPVWKNDEPDNSFSCALGDVDGDGDLDLATISGYFGPAPVRVYKNNNGALEKTASWHTPVDYNANDVGWCDVDNDGDLDLVIAGHDQPVYLFANVGGVLQTTPSWQSNLSAQFNQVTFGDVNGDGWRDMVVSENLPAGRVLLFTNVGGAFDPDFHWFAPIDYASCVKFGDADADGDLDLAGGGWWSEIQVFENNGGSFAGGPAWSYYPAAGALVCEQAVWADVDNDGVRFKTERYDGDGSRRLFYLKHAPLQYFYYAKVAGRTLAPGEYCFHPEGGWVSLAEAPPAGNANVEFSYAYSDDLELAVTNWDEPAGSFLFNNTRGAVEVADFLLVPADAALTARWHVTSGMGELAGFNLRRRLVLGPGEGGPVVKINGALITGGGPTFSFTDNDVLMGETYDYWLEAVATSGAKTTFGPARGTVFARAVVLGQNYPNPAAAATTVPFGLNAGANVTLAVYDLAGRKVATFMDGYAGPGVHKVAANVSALPAGVYIYRLAAGDEAATRRMVVAR